MEDREPIPENYFSIWKDEAMIEWDRFIYNIRFYERNLTSNIPKDFNDIIMFYGINFNIIITLDDIEEKPYLFPLAFKYLKASRLTINLFPNNEDLRKLIFYNQDFLLRLSNIYEDPIEDILFYHSTDSYNSLVNNFKFQRRKDSISYEGFFNIDTIRYIQFKFNTYDEMMRDIREFQFQRSSDQRIGNPNKLRVNIYDKVIDNVKYLRVKDIRTKELNNNLLYLDSISDAKVNTLPDSLKKFTHSSAINNYTYSRLPNRLQDVTLTTKRLLNLPSSVRSLSIPDINMVKNIERLECVNLHSLIQIDVLRLTNLKILSIYDTEKRQDFSTLVNLEIFHCHKILNRVILPKKS